MVNKLATQVMFSSFVSITRVSSYPTSTRNLWYAIKEHSEVRRKILRARNSFQCNKSLPDLHLQPTSHNIKTQRHAQTLYNRRTYVPVLTQVHMSLTSVCVMIPEGEVQHLPEDEVFSDDGFHRLVTPHVSV